MALIIRGTLAKGIVALNPNLTYFTLNEEFDLDPADTMVSIGLRKIDDKLEEKLNTALATITEETRMSLMQNAVNNGNSES